MQQLLHLVGFISLLSMMHGTTNITLKFVSAIQLFVKLHTKHADILSED